VKTKASEEFYSPNLPDKYKADWDTLGSSSA